MEAIGGRYVANNIAHVSLLGEIAPKENRAIPDPPGSTSDQQEDATYTRSLPCVVGPVL